jgi:hypothetical protein
MPSLLVDFIAEGGFVHDYVVIHFSHDFIQAGIDPTCGEGSNSGYFRSMDGSRFTYFYLVEGARPRLAMLPRIIVLQQAFWETGAENYVGLLP